MKRVRKEDLKILIALYYCKFLDPEHTPINDIVNDVGDIKININSIFINVTNIKNEFKDIDTFSRNIEAITLGNLKVTYWDTLSIHIANSYEIAGLN